MKTKKLLITIHASMNSFGTTEFSFTLFPSDVNKIKDRFNFTPTRGISIFYDEKFSWDYYLKHFKKHIENIFSLGNFTEDEVEFKWNINY